MGGEAVLIVDDNPANLSLMRFLLAAEQYDVRTANSAEEALSFLGSFRPRLVLTDIQLPGMDGFEFTRRLKSSPAMQDIIVVAITAYTGTGDEEQAWNAGCNGYVTKPVDIRTLPAAIRQHLDPGQAVPAFKTGDYHDLLTELRSSFLVEGEEEGRRLLLELARGFNAGSVQRIAHRWAGIAGILGFPEIAGRAHKIVEFLENPGGIKGGASVMIASGEYASRLRSELFSVLQMFSDAVLGRRETPALPMAVQRILSQKIFAVIGFEDAEGARITRALTHAGSASQVFNDPPENGILRPFHAAVVNVRPGHTASSWIQTGVFAFSEKPILFVGAAESLLRREPLLVERACDFLLGPWDSDELIFRAYRLFPSDAGREKQAGPSALRGAPPAPANQAWT